MYKISKMNFDICSYCNHQCTFCSNPDKRTIKNKVNAESFKIVMNNITKYLDIKELGLSAKGEVLLNNNLESIISLAKDKYKINYVYISTNGSLLTEDKAKKLLDAKLDSIKFSINAFDEESYKRVHQQDDFKLVIKNFKNLLRLKREHYPSTKILISSVTNKDEKEIKQLFKNIFGDDFNLIDIISKYKIAFTPKFESYTKNIKNIKPCPLVLNEIYIDSDCRLGLCCKDYFKEFDFGSLLTNDFKILYDNNQLEELRKMHINKSLPDGHFCQKCLLFESLL